MSLLELRVEAFAKLAISTGAEVVHLRLAMKGIHEQSFSLTASNGSPGRENLHQRLQFYKRNFAVVFQVSKGVTFVVQTGELPCPTDVSRDCKCVFHSCC